MSPRNLGPIQPVKLSGDMSSSALTATAGAIGAASAFAVKRDRKFLAHTGNEDSLPRYVTLDTSVRHSAGAAAQNPVSLPTSKVDAVKPAKVLVDMAEKAVLTLNAVSSSAVAEVASELTCATGTCSFKPRESAEVPLMDANGKILSGPGRTYDAVPPKSLGVNSAGVKIKPPVHLPSKKIMKAVGQAIKDWSMIEEGDRILLGLSGGKDSLALLHILLAVQVGLLYVSDFYLFPYLIFRIFMYRNVLL